LYGFLEGAKNGSVFAQPTNANHVSRMNLTDNPDLFGIIKDDLDVNAS
jgi:hypothetical protein